MFLFGFLGVKSRLLDRGFPSKTSWNWKQLDMIRLSIGALVALCVAPALADPRPFQPSMPTAEREASEPAMPQREGALIEIFNKARREFDAARRNDERRQTRLEMQVHEADFMKASATARDWIGIVQESHATPEGVAWIAIEISPGIRIMTAKSRSEDLNSLTLITRGSSLYDVINGLATGQAIIFSATFLGGRLGSDEDMVKRPEIMAHFISVRAVE